MSIHFVVYKIHRGEKMTVTTEVACLVSIGCGIFPPEPIGNADIVDAMSARKLTQLPSKVKDMVTMLTTAVSQLIMAGHL